jgi:hypothetical protein
VSWLFWQAGFGQYIPGLILGAWAFHRLFFVLPAQRKATLAAVAAAAQPAVLDADWNRIRTLELDLYGKLLEHGQWPGHPLGAGPPDGWYPAGYDFETGRVPPVVTIAEAWMAAGHPAADPVVHWCRRPDLPAACGAGFWDRWKSAQAKDVNCQPCLARMNQPSLVTCISGLDHQISAAFGVPGPDVAAGTEWHHRVAEIRRNLRLAGKTTAEISAALAELERRASKG